ncbi:hypothetical protein EYF80_023930 [Liparis tanakae]|uniref:Uncharacterized protein n=1 Tax=Liparis tanakae TaxID=230148 RepID=A0A4Z2HIZ4_9TELE|nr:hypothetical protein EYF80_023930 [Liparis tanakae]
MECRTVAVNLPTHYPHGVGAGSLLTAARAAGPRSEESQTSRKRRKKDEAGKAKNWRRKQQRWAQDLKRMVERMGGDGGKNGKEVRGEGERRQPGL